METPADLTDLAMRYHRTLPGRIRRYLNERGISDLLIDFHLLGWNGNRIAIPIPDREGKISFFKLARDPEDKTPGPKMLATRGSGAELYGWEAVLKKPTQIVICEGEFDRLVLENEGFFSVTSTGGAGVFRREWAEYFKEIPEVYVCFDNDEAGRQGAERVGQMIPRAQIVQLPEDVGPGGDVTDFFVRLNHSRADFEDLMSRAMPALPDPPAPPRPPQGSQSDLRERIEHIKRDHAIVDVVGRYLRLQPSGDGFTGLCPFHQDHNPSFVVFPKTGTFRCFGCGRHGDVITFVREIEGLGFGEALQRLEYLHPHEPEAPQTQ
jgi:DNA primase